MDMSKYLGLFVSEASEHLESLGRELLALEKEKTRDRVDAMFRHAHSVKGMASSMGFESIAVLAHRVEDLVDSVRGDLALLSREVVDALFAAADALSAQVKAAAAGLPPPDSGKLLEILNAQVAALTGKAPDPTPVLDATALPAPRPPPPEAATAPRPDAPLGLPPRFAVRVRIAHTCQVPGVRAFLVHKKLSGLGTIHDLKPALEELKAGRIPEGMISLELEAQAGEAGIQQAVKNISEVELVSVKPAPPPQPAAPPAPSGAAPVPGPTGSVVGERPRDPAEVGRTVRVKTELLDYFLDAVGELMLATARIREVGKVLPAPARPPLEEAVYRLHALVKDLHDKVMSVRMTPLSVITDRLPRASRDIARRRFRDVELVITGAEIELDRAIIDDLADPLLHLLRNCIDHGIEPAEQRAEAKKPAAGRIQVAVRRQRDRVVIELEDDGRGMDAQKLKDSAIARGLLAAEAAQRMTDKEAYMLSCLPGVSTAADVSEISGRGVGMDAVKRAVESVGGTLEIESERGRGTRFTLRLPLTVAVVNLLLVQSGAEIVGLPIGKVLAVLEADHEALSRSRETPLISHGNSLLPVHVLAELLHVPPTPRKGVRPYLVMESDTGKVALAVDRLLGQEEVVLKALSRPLDLVAGLSGVTILGSGRPIFILDVPRLIAA
ncbi:MAG TPA: chemotaxis protein CheA [Myxococcaceae bacterium]|jgi:two-component system chemotaxis sensor kinase CheA